MKEKAFHVEHRPELLLDAQLAELQRLASLGVLAGAVLHEINNALTPALSYSQLALANPQDRDLATKALERAVSGIRHASRIAESTLGLVMVAEKAVPSCGSAAAVRDVLEATRSSVMHLVEQAGVTLSICCPDEHIIPMNPLELQQVLVNLITNSIRAMSRGGVVSVNCSTWKQPQFESGVEIEVVDDGKGVPSEIRSRLFQPLASSRVGGHGFGLMVSRQLVEAAGGQLEFDHTHEPGARFIVKIPYK